MKVQFNRADLSCSTCLTAWVNYRDLGGGLVVLVICKEKLSMKTASPLSFPLEVSIYSVSE